MKSAYTAFLIGATLPALSWAQFQDFATRCNKALNPGVVRCIGFDSPADVPLVTYGAYGIFNDQFQNAPVLDASVAASGPSSLKFTITTSEPNSGGSYFANFSDDYSVQFDGGQEFYVQWRQRFSPEFVQRNQLSLGNGGWKQVDISAGDQPGCNGLSMNSGGFCASSCTAIEAVVVNGWYRGFPTMYNSCTGSSSTQNGTMPNGTGPFNGFEPPFGNSDFMLQNARPAPYCLYSQGNTTPVTFFPPVGNCIGYFANEWMTFQVHIQIGQRTNDYFANSHVDMWVAREGQPSQQTINFGPYDLAAGPAATTPYAPLKFGKIWLMPYDTNNSHPTPTPVPTAYTWYDELIISRSKIADPGATPMPTDTLPPAKPQGLVLR